MQISRFIAALKKANIALDRKVLADLATNDPKAFSTVLAEVRRYKALAGCTGNSVREDQEAPLLRRAPAWDLAQH
jgi:hypothetical protein